MANMNRLVMRQLLTNQLAIMRALAGLGVQQMDKDARNKMAMAAGDTVKVIADISEPLPIQRTPRNLNDDINAVLGVAPPIPRPGKWFPAFAALYVGGVKFSVKGCELRLVDVNNADRYELRNPVVFPATSFPGVGFVRFSSSVGHYCFDQSVPPIKKGGIVTLEARSQPPNPKRK